MRAWLWGLAATGAALVLLAGSCSQEPERPAGTGGSQSGAGGTAGAGAAGGAAGAGGAANSGGKGGGGGAGGSGGATACVCDCNVGMGETYECQQCLRQECCLEYQACATEEDCWDLFACGARNGACEAECCYPICTTPLCYPFWKTCADCLSANCCTEFEACWADAACQGCMNSTSSCDETTLDEDARCCRESLCTWECYDGPGGPDPCEPGTGGHAGHGGGGSGGSGGTGGQGG